MVQYILYKTESSENKTQGGLIKRAYTPKFLIQLHEKLSGTPIGERKITTTGVTASTRTNAGPAATGKNSLDGKKVADGNTKLINDYLTSHQKKYVNSLTIFGKHTGKEKDAVTSGDLFLKLQSRTNEIALFLADNPQINSFDDLQAYMSGNQRQGSKTPLKAWQLHEATNIALRSLWNEIPSTQPSGYSRISESIYRDLYRILPDNYNAVTSDASVVAEDQFSAKYFPFDQDDSFERTHLFTHWDRFYSEKEGE